MRIEPVRPQILSCLHSISASQWFNLVTGCFLLVKLQLQSFPTSP